MKELADSLDADSEKLLERWDGRPDLVIEDIFRVRDLETKEISDLELTPYQRKFVHAYWYADESTTAVLKGRRTGYSFIACCVILLDAIVTPHSFMAITAPSKSQAKDRIEDIYDLIDWSRLSFDLETDNRDEITLSNGSTMMAFAGSPDTSRGADSADTLYIDEMAFLEDQEESMRGFSPFVALGDAQTVQISTPKLSNDLFMEDFDRGSESGQNGIISIEQPAFEDPQSIDENHSLLDQDVNPVMPYLDLQEAEKDRARDPMGFRQEYLCEPVDDEYRFFHEPSVLSAIERGKGEKYLAGPTAAGNFDSQVIMGVDIAVSHDDTAISIVEHDGKYRNLRYKEAVTNETLAKAGVSPPRRSNPSALAQRIRQLHRPNGVDQVIIDTTGVGEGFSDEIRETIGRGITSFNFSDKEAVAEMMGDLNYGLHNEFVTMYPGEKLRKQILAIVKKQRSDYSKPKFTGKDHAPNGKDDLAISFALACYPPNMNNKARNLQSKEKPSGDMDGVEQIELGSVSSIDNSESVEAENVKEGYRGASHSKGNSRSTRGNQRYKRRYRR